MARAAVEGLAFPEEKKTYIVDVLDPILEEMVQELLTHIPPDPVGYMISWLRRRNGSSSVPLRESLREKNASLKKELKSLQGFVQEVGAIVKNKEPEHSSEEEEEDDADDEPPPPPPKSMRARQSVSAEAYGMWNQKKEFTPPKVPKSEEQMARLRRILSSSFLFKQLDNKDMDVVLLAMKEVMFEPGARIITEGEDGNHLFVIEEGSPECKKLIDGELKVVKKCSPGDVFGELALLYNNPRAATVDATDKCHCWELDRETFNHIVKESATKTRQRWDDFLKSVSLFAGMDSYQRAQLSDALKLESYSKDDYIVRQAEQGDTFYIVEEGSLAAMKVKEDGTDPEQVMAYSPGDYFGELALLKDQPRAASIKVTSEEAKVLALDRKSFKKMLGPLEDLLKQHADLYK